MIFSLTFATGLVLSSIDEKKNSLEKNVASKENYLAVDSVLQSQNPIDLSISQEVSLSPSSPSFLAKNKTMSALMDQDNTYQGSSEASEYIVVSGDTLKSLSEKFGISIETIAFANNITTSQKLKPGQKLLILPVDGLLYLVKKGDTISELAETYKVSAEKIIEFNDLSDNGGICFGDLIIIPEAKKPKTVSTLLKSVSIPVSNSYFIYPIPLPCKMTQGPHWFNAVDFANGNCGDPVFASAGGEVQKTGVGANSGNYVNILHPNGAITFYGHLSKFIVKAGDKVSQGQIIGYVGHTGNTIPSGEAGCHLHFDVRFADNPFSKIPVDSTITK